MANVYDRINPVTGRSYNTEFASAPGNPGQNFGMGFQPTSFQQPSVQQPAQNPGYLNMRAQVQTGADFMPEQKRLQDLLTNPSSIQGDPSYQFRLDQGNQEINRSAAAKGMLGSGNVLAELAKYGQGMASNEYGNQFNRLSSLIGQKQKFGLQSGYYDEPTRTTGGWEGGGYVTRRDENPTFW